MNPKLEYPKCYQCGIQHGSIRGGRIVLLRLVPVEGLAERQWCCVDHAPTQPPTKVDSSLEAMTRRTVDNLTPSEREVLVKRFSDGKDKP